MANDKARKATSGQKKKVHKRAYKKGSIQKKRQWAKRKKSILKISLAVTVVAVLIFAITQLALFLSVRKYDGDTAMNGVYIGNLHVGGMTLEQMETELNKRIVDSGEGV